MPKKTKKDKTTERTWNLKIFKQRTITKEEFEENKEDIMNMLENLYQIVENSSLFIHEIHCNSFKQVFSFSTKILRYLDEEEMNQIKKITKFYKEKCDSRPAKPQVHVDDFWKK